LPKIAEILVQLVGLRVFQFGAIIDSSFSPVLPKIAEIRRNFVGLCVFPILAILAIFFSPSPGFFTRGFFR